jgi:fructose-specific phosphotransferase system IIA component
MVDIQHYLSEKRIAFMETTDKDEALEHLVTVAEEPRMVSDYQAFHDAVFHRESIVTTGIGQHVAIPHIKHDSVKEFFITIGISKRGVEWHSFDKKPVHLAFLIAGPEDHEHYLQIIAKLTLIVRNPTLRSDIINCTTPGDVMWCFTDI